MPTNKTSEAVAETDIDQLFYSECSSMVNGRTWAEGHDWDEKYFCVNCFQKKFEAIQRKYKRMEEALQEIAKDGQMIFGFGSTKETLESGNDLNSKIKLAQDTLAFDPLSE